MKHRLFTKIASFFAACAAISPVLMPVASRAASSDEDDVERATTSSVASFRLPENTLRYTNQTELTKFEEALQKVAEVNHGQVGKYEVLVWTNKEPMKTIPNRLKDAGYTYKTQSAVESEAGRLTPMSAVGRDPKEKKRDLMGMWIEKDNILLLAWGVFTSDNSEKSGQPNKPEKVEAASLTDGKVPGDLLGSWMMTTISGVFYQDKFTGRTSAPSGMASKYTFTKDGRYKSFFYIRQQTYSLVTESTTTEEGTVTFNNDGSMNLKPSKGHYNGHTGSRIIDRDMTESERKAKTWYWEWRTTDGKRQLYMGPTKEAVKLFKRSE